ncbi:MAG: stage II sporulation protein M [Nanoarchaeota archaeon]
MVLESLINPAKLEKTPRNMIFVGFLYCCVAVLLSHWIFKTYASMIMVFLTAIACIPLMYHTIKWEEEKDLQDFTERMLLKEHFRALSGFMYLFIGFVLAFTFIYVFVPSDFLSVLFDSQTSTIQAINGRMTGMTVASSMGLFGKIFLNNVKVLVFCLLFSFLYGAGGIFILTWNASVIGAAIGNFIRTNLTLVSDTFGFEHLGSYFQIFSIGLFKYSIHGIPEILAYFAAGLAGGIISVAVIKHDFGNRKFEHVLLDSADLIILSIVLLLIAAVLEVFVTPAIF